MSYLILPHRWRRQPQQPTAVDWGHPSARRLRVLWTPQHHNKSVGEVPLAGGTHGEYSRGTFGDGEIGGTWGPVNAATGLNFGTVQPITNTTGITALAVMQISNTTYADGIFTQRKSASAFQQHSFIANWRTTGVSTDHYGYIGLANYDGTGWAGKVEVLAGCDGTRHVVVIGNSNVASTAYCYIDGKAQTLAAEAAMSGTSVDSAQETWIGSLQGLASWGFPGYLGLVAVWDRRLAPAEAQELSRNPYQLLQPIRRPVYFIPAPLNNYTLTADVGSFTLTGIDAGLTVARTIAADAGAFTLTGVDADLIYAQAGAYTLTADAGTFALTGNDVEFRYFNLAAETGTFSLTGINVGLIYSGAPPATTEQPAGRPSRDRKPSRRKRKPVIVTIDGQDFVVSSEAEAQQLADAAAEIATQKAEEQAAAIIAKRERKARKADLNLAPLTLDLPQIEVRAPSDSTAPAAWLADVQARMQAVYDAYQAVADKAELALRVRHQQELDEEDELVTTILLS